MSATVHDYPCFDFVLRSQMPLPELPDRAGTVDDRATVAVREGRIAAIDGQASDAVPEISVAGDVAVLTIPDIARFRISGGTDILIDPAPGASPRMVRLFLLGSALGIVAMQRGLMLLHANAVVVDGGAHAFGGQSGAGKSTLAAHFQRAGYPILCDDVCGVTFANDGVPLAWPGLPRIKLWRDAAEALGHDPAGLDRVIDDHEKYQVPFVERSPTAPVPLRALYVLERADDAAAGAITPIRGTAAMAALMENSYRAGYLAPLGFAARHFGHCVMLLRHARVYRATRAWGHDVFAREVARIEGHMMGARA